MTTAVPLRNGDYYLGGCGICGWAPGNHTQALAFVVFAVASDVEHLTVIPRRHGRTSFEGALGKKL